MPTQIASLYAAIGADLSGLNRGLLTAKGMLGGFGKIAGVGFGLATAAAVGAGVAIAKVTKDVMGVTADYESQLAILNIAAKGAGLTLGELDEATLKVGGDTRLVGVDAMQTADAITNLFKAGLKTEEIFGDLQGYMAGTTDLGGALRASIDLAAASELDMDQASQLAAIALATFGGGLETAEERANFINSALNNLMKTADGSVAEVEDLAGALQMVGPSAAQLKIPLEDVNTALGILSEGGIMGTRAGSNIDAMLRSLTDPSKDAVETLNALKIDLWDDKGQFIGLEAMIGEFEKAMAGMTDEQISGALGSIFTAQGARAMNKLLGAETEGWIDMEAAIEGAATMEEQAAARANTLQGAQEALAGAIQTLKIAAGKELLPVLTDLTRWAAEMVTKYGPTVVEIVKKIGDVIYAFASGSPSSAPWHDLFPDSEWFANMMETISGWFENGISLDGFDLAGMLPPEALQLWEAFQRLLDTMGEWWDTHGPDIMKSARELGRVLKSVFMELVTRVIPWLVEKLDQFGAWWMDNGPLIVTFVDNVAKWIGLMAQSVVLMWAIVKPVLDLFLGYVANMARLMMAIATGDWSEAWDAFGDIVFNAWEAIKRIIKTAIGVLGAIIDTFLEKVFGISLPKWAGGSGNGEEQTDEGGGAGLPTAALPGDQPTAGPWSDWTGGGSQATTNNYFNQTVNTRATTPSVTQDYHMMQARVGAR